MEEQNIQNCSGDLNADAQIFLKMGQLLQKERSPEAQKLIEAIVNNEKMPLAEKVNRIESLDATEVEKNLSDEKVSKNEINDLIRRKHIVTQEMAVESLSKIKRRYRRATAIFYMFSEYSRIRDFGKATGFLKAKFFLPKIRFNQDTILMMSATLLTEIPHLLSMLTFITEVGWKILNKFEYNLIVQFKRLCETVVILKYESVNYDIPNITESFSILESLFLLCHYKVEYPGIILSSMNVALKQHNKPADKVEMAHSTAKKILHQFGASPSLYNFILALNMQETRRVLGLRDLINIRQEGIINTFDYDCDESAKAAIRGHQNELMVKITNISIEKREAEKVHRFLDKFLKPSEDEPMNCDFSMLSNYYEFNNPKNNLRFSRDKSNMVFFAVNFYTKLLKDFSDFLIGKTQIDGIGEVQLFSINFFYPGVNNLDCNLHKMNENYYNSSDFSRQRFYEMRTLNKDISPSPEEALMMDLIEDLSRITVEIAKKLGHLVVSHKPGDVTATAETYKPMEVNLMMRPDYSNPFYNRRLKNSGFFDNLTLIETMSGLTILLLMAGVFFYDSHLYALMEDEKHIKEQYAKTRDMLEKVADPVTFEKIRRTQSI